MLRREEGVCDDEITWCKCQDAIRIGLNRGLYRHAAEQHPPGPMNSSSVFRPRLPFDPFADLVHPWRVHPVLPGSAPAVVLLIGGPLPQSLPLCPV